MQLLLNADSPAPSLAASRLMRWAPGRRLLFRRCGDVSKESIGVREINETLASQASYSIRNSYLKGLMEKGRINPRGNDCAGASAGGNGWEDAQHELAGIEGGRLRGLGFVSVCVGGYGNGYSRINCLRTIRYRRCLQIIVPRQITPRRTIFCNHDIRFFEHRLQFRF